MVKINFSGGEPFLPQKGNYVGELVKFCKQELKLPSVTIVSNGSLIKEAWFAKYGRYAYFCRTSWSTIFAMAQLIIPYVVLSA